MKVTEKLESSLKRRDEVPNIELSEQIASGKDKAAVKELAENLSSKSKDIQNDSIKVLYEFGEINPSLISEYSDIF